MIDQFKDISNILLGIKTASNSCGLKCHLIGNYVWKTIYPNVSIDNRLSFVVYGSFDINEFYEALVKNLTVNYEIENSEKIYSFISDNYIVEININDKTNIINLDKLTYDIQNDTTTPDVPDRILFLSNPITTRDLIHAACACANTELPIDNLEGLIVSESDNDIIDVLGTTNPGSAVSILEKVMGSEWVSSQLINLAIAQNVPLNEDVTSESILSEDVKSTLNSYGNFFKDRVDRYNENRILSSLRVLFDSPVEDSIPYIHEIKSLSQTDSFKTSALPTEHLYPPSECDPLACSPQCCCCITADIVSDVALRCHEKVHLSCNKTGTSSGPDADPFPSGCTECTRSCQGLIADSHGLPNPTGITCSNISSMDWWNDDPNSVCRCECKERNKPTDLCELTCLFCNEYCESEFIVEQSTNTDCHFRAFVKPSTSCCGDPSAVDFMFVIDFSSSMSGEIAEVKSQITALVSKLSNSGASVRVGITSFGRESSQPAVELQFTDDISEFESTLEELEIGGSGSSEYDLAAIEFAITNGQWSGRKRYLMLLGDEPTQYQGSETKEQISLFAQQLDVTVFASNVGSTERSYIATATGGSLFNLSDTFSEIVDGLNLLSLPSSCDCLGSDYIPVYRNTSECIDPVTGEPRDDAPSHCRDIPIGKCTKSEDCSNACDLPYALYACGHTIIVNPIKISMECCDQVGYGCGCNETPPPGQCCGPDENCDPICNPITGDPLFSSLELAQDYVWCRCFDKAAYRENPSCSSCCCPDESLSPGHIWYPCDKLREDLDSHPEYNQYLNSSPPICCDVPADRKDDCCNLCVWVDDGRGGHTRYCKGEIFDQVAAKYLECKSPSTNPVEWECPQEKCNREDECIVSNPLSNDPCNEISNGHVKHPSVVVLNNGIGLVAYESRDGVNPVSAIRIEQFHTSAASKILPNRIFNYGRLENKTKWGQTLVDGKKTAKLYFYEDVPEYLVTTTSGVVVESSFKKSSEEIEVTPSSDVSIVPIDPVAPYYTKYNPVSFAYTIKNPFPQSLEIEVSVLRQSFSDPPWVLLPWSVTSQTYTITGNRSLTVVFTVDSNKLDELSSGDHYTIISFSPVIENYHPRSIEGSVRRVKFSSSGNTSGGGSGGGGGTTDPPDPPPVGVEDIINVSPASDFITSVYRGSEILSKSTSYIIKNISSSTITWSITNTSNWIFLDKTSGTLSPGSSDSVTVTIETNTNNLYNNSYSGYLYFKNNINESYETRRIILNVLDTVYPYDWDDSISFRSGPLKGQCFPLAADPSTSSPIGSDAIGNYILFFVPDDLNLTTPFPSFDDSYNTQWFLSNKTDEGLIGDATDDVTAGSEFKITSSEEVDRRLKSINHVYNGSAVPVAYPSIATATNYQNSSENAHHVFLSYQALEDGKWNIYLRHIRLSEYDKDSQIINATDESLVSVLDIETEDVIYRVTCVSDECKEFSNEYYAKRTVVFEVMLPDGREVLNANMSGQDTWGSLCDGHEESLFPKKKVFVKFSHVAVVNKCPDQFEMDEMFYNWQVGEQYFVPLSIYSETQMFSLIKRNNDSCVSLGYYGNNPATVGTVKVSSSTIGAVWYSEIGDGWVVMSGDSLDTITEFKGFFISEPILISPDTTEHCLRPVISVSYNNDIYICYESIVNGIPHIKIVGTDIPSESLPGGNLTPKDLDRTLGYSLRFGDFTYSNQITSTGINQSPDMYIDKNDVVHLTWQSNRDGDWEIYYARSSTGFANERITKSKGKSFNPSITGNDDGHLYITWHDNRFGSYEIMMAYMMRRRILPYSQQDSYLSGKRNNYTHYEDTVPLTLVNSTELTICMNSLRAIFYNDRLKTSSAFEISSDSFPLSFDFEENNALYNETHSISFSAFDNWQETALSGVSTITSPEFESTIGKAKILRLQIEATVDTGDGLYLYVRASDIQNDPLADQQWNGPFDVTDSTGQWIYPQDIEIDSVSGKYMQIRLENYYNTSESVINEFTIELYSNFRLCLNPSQEIPMNLKLSPEIRVKGTTGDEVSTPISELFSQNNTYFISVSGITEDGRTVTVSNENVTVSCLECKRSIISNNSKTCSYLVTANNESDSSYYNFEVVFYSDIEKEKLALSLSLEYGSFDLRNIQLSDGRKAEDVWTTDGILVPEGNSFSFIIYPPTSNIGSIQCGVEYYIDIVASKKSIVTEEIVSEEIVSSKTFLCDCNSARWIFDDPVDNISEKYRWSSSGFGKSDTRITDTSSNNYNSVVQVRSNKEVIVSYESDRDGEKRIYASVVNVLPNFDSFASGSESIASQENVYPRTDISLENSGQNVSFTFDYYDNLFMAFEQSINTDSSDRTIIKIKRCGLTDIDYEMKFDERPISEETPETSGTEGCIPNLTCYVSEEDSSFINLVRKVMVNKEHVRYSVYKNGKVIPVVNTCSISFTVVGSPETIAIRAKNKTTDAWSDWMPMDHETGDYTSEIEWRLLPYSGAKTVHFQIATYSGLGVNFSQDIIADYDSVGYIINMYKPIVGKVSPPDPVSILDLSDEEIFSENNLLNVFDKLYPVASVRQGELVDNSWEQKGEDYIFIEIVPDNSYIDNLTSLGVNIQNATPLFDFISQGDYDLTAQPTVYFQYGGKHSFRGFIKIKTETISSLSDGLAYIVPHFYGDCNSNYDSISTQENKATDDMFNSVSKVTSETDPFSGHRDIYGNIQHRIVIRPGDDPYFVFGDPKYYEPN